MKHCWLKFKKHEYSVYFHNQVRDFYTGDKLLVTILKCHCGAWKTQIGKPAWDNSIVTPVK